MFGVNNLASKLLEISKHLVNSRKSFNLTLKTRDIDFTFSSKDMDLHSEAIKKRKSPSTLRRNAARKKKIFKKKSLEPTEDLDSNAVSMAQSYHLIKYCRS